MFPKVRIPPPSCRRSCLWRRCESSNWELSPASVLISRKDSSWGFLVISFRKREMLMPRRLSLASPDSSLLLFKGMAKIPRSFSWSSRLRAMMASRMLGTRSNIGMKTPAFLSAPLQSIGCIAANHPTGAPPCSLWIKCKPYKGLTLRILSGILDTYHNSRMPLNANCWQTTAEEGYVLLVGFP